MAELRKRGLVTAVVCSDPFVTLGKNQARGFGVPDLPLIVIPHPLGGLGLDGVKAPAGVATPLPTRLWSHRLRRFDLKPRVFGFASMLQWACQSTS